MDLTAVAGGLAVTWAIAQKLGGFLRARKVAGQALGYIEYARDNLIALNDLVLEIERAMADDRVSPEEIRVLVAKAAALSRTLRKRQTLAGAVDELVKLAPKA